MYAQMASGHECSPALVLGSHGHVKLNSCRVPSLPGCETVKLVKGYESSPVLDLKSHGHVKLELLSRCFLTENYGTAGRPGELTCF